jgi:hypothetical protein
MIVLLASAIAATFVGRRANSAATAEAPQLIDWNRMAPQGIVFAERSGGELRGEIFQIEGSVKHPPG